MPVSVTLAGLLPLVPLKWGAFLAAPGMSEPAKPAILQDQRFTVREGLAYRAMRTGAPVFRPEASEV